MYFYPNADIGSCDVDPTEFEGATLQWPETTIGAQAMLQCPATMGTATRVCGNAGMWEAPDTTACIDVQGVIEELTSMVSALAAKSMHLPYNIYVCLPTVPMRCHQ